MGDLDSSSPSVSGALSAADHVGLVNEIKGMLNDIRGQDSGYIDSLSPKVNQKVQILQGLQKKHDELEAKFCEERAALEKKYWELDASDYAKRHDIISGVVDTGAEEEDPAVDPAAEEEAEKEKGVPEFWLTAMKANKVLMSQITERDEGALKYLMDIECVHLDNPKGFRLDFYFDTNPFFKNSLLRKTYHVDDEDEPIVERATGTEIEWNAGKNLTQNVVEKQPKKDAKNAEPVIKIEQCSSFFNFFSPPQVPEGDDEEEPENLQYMMEQEQDYDIGWSIIKDNILPLAVTWFQWDALLKCFDFDTDDEDKYKYYVTWFQWDALLKCSDFDTDDEDKYKYDDDDDGTFVMVPAL